MIIGINYDYARKLFEGINTEIDRIIAEKTSKTQKKDQLSMIRYEADIIRTDFINKAMEKIDRNYTYSEIKTLTGTIHKIMERISNLEIDNFLEVEIIRSLDLAERVATKYLLFDLKWNEQ